MQQNPAHMDKNLTDLEHRPRILPPVFFGNKFSQKIKKGSYLVLKWYNDYNCTGTVYVAFHSSFKHISLVVHVIIANLIMLTMLLVGFLLECSLFYMAHRSCLPSFCQKFHQEWSKGNPLKPKNKTKQNNTFQCIHEYIFIFQNNSLISVTDGS